MVLEGCPARSAIYCQHSEDNEQRMGYVVNFFVLWVLNTSPPLGIFAGKQKIPKGSFIGIYSGELLSEDEGDERGK